MDYAATTPVRPEVIQAMSPYFGECFGNASTIYSWGREARSALDQARDAVAAALGCEASEVVFTSGGSEADNLAIKGIAFANRDRGDHIITSAVEHHAVYDTVKWLEKHGFRATYLPVDGHGMVDPGELAGAITDKTVLVTVMHANNEVGTIQPISEIGRIARERNVPFHTDAVQSAGTIPVNVKALNCDLLSVSAHKFHGPKGVGALYIKKRTRIEPHIHGGAQERNRRAGTENIPGIVGLAEALQLAVSEQGEKAAHLLGLRERMVDGLRSAVDHIRLNGHPTERLPGNVNVCFEFVEGESLLLNLDMAGVAASSGSACTSGSLEPSHVLLAMGVPPEVAHGSLRLTLGRDNTEEDVDHVLEVLPPIVEKLRQMSPLYPRVSR